MERQDGYPDITDHEPEHRELMDAKSLPAVKMPNRDGFISDPRPDVLNYR